MADCCDLQLDVNGEETFLVNKVARENFSNRVVKLFAHSICARRDLLKVIFHNCSGSADSLELTSRFCYNDGRFLIAPCDIGRVYCSAYIVKMEADDSGRPNLMFQIEKLLEGMHFWTWSECLEALKQCQDFVPATNALPLRDKILSYLIERLASTGISSPYICSSNSSSFQFFSDTSGITSWRNSCSHSTWWFEDLLFLNSEFLVLMINKMVSQNFDHSKISKFLFYYHHHKLSYHCTTPAEKLAITEVVFNVLLLLRRNSIYCKDLFDFYRVGLSLNMATFCKIRIESLIGSLLDQVTIDYLLLPSPQRMTGAFDMDLVMRLMKAFIHEGNFGASLNRLKRVADLLDSYLLEVAPDPHLKPSKFAALISALPDSARESHDRLFLAINLYLKVHQGLGDKEKMHICCALKLEKLSGEELKRLAQNSIFSSEAGVRAQVTKEYKIQSLQQETKTLIDTMFCKTFKKNLGERDNVLSDSSSTMSRLSVEARKLQADLQMRSSVVVETHNAFVETQSQRKIQNMTKSRSLGSSKSRYLPKLCSWELKK